MSINGTCAHVVIGISKLVLYFRVTVALSIMEVEYMALTVTIKEMIWLEGLLDNLGIE